MLARALRRMAAPAVIVGLLVVALPLGGPVACDGCSTSISTSELPVGIVGQEYFVQLDSDCGGDQWFLDEGILPPGIALSNGGKLDPIRGEVVSITAARNEIVMHHEPIAGFMQGMTMPFPVANRDLLEGIEPGDRVEGVLLVEGARYALVSLAEIPKPTPAAE